MTPFNENFQQCVTFILTVFNLKKDHMVKMQREIIALCPGGNWK